MAQPTQEQVVAVANLLEGMAENAMDDGDFRSFDEAWEGAARRLQSMADDEGVGPLLADGTLAPEAEGLTPSTLRTAIRIASGR